MKTPVAIVLAAIFIIAADAGAEILRGYRITGANHYYAHGNYTATGLQTVLLFVEGLDPGSAILAVSGIPGAPLTIDTSDPEGFFNAPEFGQRHGIANPQLYPAHPELQWDTYLAVGPWGGPAPGLTPGFPDIADAGGGTPIVGHENIAWFNGDPGVVPKEIGPIGQFTVSEDHWISFTLNVSVVDPSGHTRHIDGLTLTVPAVPAPGSALLLASVLMSRRRRL